MRTVYRQFTGSSQKSFVRVRPSQNRPQALTRRELKRTTTQVKSSETSNADAIPTFEFGHQNFAVRLEPFFSGLRVTAEAFGEHFNQHFFVHVRHTLIMPVFAYTRAMPILYQYACFSCRKVFKQSWSGQLGANVCPECAKPMSYMGTAFRAPKQSNLDQWKKAELLIEAGFDFTRNGGPKPRTLKDVPAFLEAHRLARRSPGERLLDDLKAQESGQETPVTRAKNQGRVKRLKLEGRPRFELLGRELTSWSTVLINVNGQWQEGIFRFTGDGGKTVEPHVEVKVATGTSGRRIFVTKQTVLRWPD
jgi:hypothetical protein